VEQCRTVQYTRDVFRGYDVTYRHRGRYFTTRMPDDPGRFVQVAARDDYRGDHRGGGRRRDD
jgi:uncharacterized protein YcfJ